MPKAKELRPFVEKLITIAKRGVKASDAKGRTLHGASVWSRAPSSTRRSSSSCSTTLAPRFMERPGGYTRILKLGHRRGDAADVAQIELVGSEFDPKKAEAEKAAQERGRPKAPSEEERRRAAQGGGAAHPRRRQEGCGQGRPDARQGVAASQGRGEEIDDAA